MLSPPDDPAFWHGRAAEARAAATQMSDPLSRTAMFALVARYERLAIDEPAATFSMVREAWMQSHACRATAVPQLVHLQLGLYSSVTPHLPKHASSQNSWGKEAQHDRIATGSIPTEGHAVAEGHDPKKSPVASGVRLRQGSLPSMCDSGAAARHGYTAPFDGAVERGARQPDGNHIVSLR